MSSFENWEPGSDDRYPLSHEEVRYQSNCMHLENSRRARLPIIFCAKEESIADKYFEEVENGAFPSSVSVATGARLFLMVIRSTGVNL